MKKPGIIIYQSPEGKTSIEVKLEDETVWLNLNQMASLFERDKSVISRHISNIFKEGELEKASTVANFATVQTEGKRKIVRNIEYYNLDVIISVGYRVKSKRGTQFRIWANQILKDYLIRGYVINQKRLEKQLEQFNELKETIKILGNTIERKILSDEETKGLLKIITDYSYALDMLDRYDNQSLKIENTTQKSIYKLTYDEVKKQIEIVRKTFKTSKWFGQEKDNSLKSSIETIYQTFDGKDLYPSIEEKAANLLYLLVKNHPFTDGNKRIAATIFLYFLEKNGLLYSVDKNKKIPDNALVALTLMIAVSKPEEKDTMIKVTVNLINMNNR